MCVQWRADEWNSYDFESNQYSAYGTAILYKTKVFHHILTSLLGLFQQSDTSIHHAHDVHMTAMWITKWQKPLSDWWFIELCESIIIGFVVCCSVMYSPLPNISLSDVVIFKLKYDASITQNANTVGTIFQFHSSFQSLVQTNELDFTYK